MEYKKKRVNAQLGPSLFSVMILLFLIIFIGCSKSPTESEVTPPEDKLTFEEVLARGGPFESVTPSKTVDTLSTDVPETRADGSEWSCITKRFSVVEAPLDYATFNPNAEVIYPGSMLQGNSLADATPQPIVVKRAGGTISINTVNGSPVTSASVPEVKRSTIGQALNDIIKQNEGKLGAKFVFQAEQVQSREQMAFAMGVNVSTLTTEVNAKLSFSSDKEYNRYLVQLTQEFYTMSFDLPTSLDELFAPEVTPEQLARYVGPGNPAAYISSVTYGRKFYLLIESTESSEKIEAALKVSYEAAVAEGGVEVEGSQVKDLKEVKIKVFAIGGDSEKALATAFGDFSAVRDFVKHGGKIEYGRPLSYVVRSVETNRVVSVKVATEYDVKTCTLDTPAPTDKVKENSSFRLKSPGSGYVKLEKSGNIWYLKVEQGVSGAAVFQFNGDPVDYKDGASWLKMKYKPFSSSYVYQSGWGDYVYLWDGGDETHWKIYKVDKSEGWEPQIYSGESVYLRNRYYGEYMRTYSNGWVIGEDYVKKGYTGEDLKPFFWQIELVE